MLKSQFIIQGLGHACKEGSNVSGTTAVAPAFSKMIPCSTSCALTYVFTCGKCYKRRGGTRYVNGLYSVAVQKVGGDSFREMNPLGQWAYMDCRWRLCSHQSCALVFMTTPHVQTQMEILRMKLIGTPLKLTVISKYCTASPYDYLLAQL